jgi:hypothetical protein
MDRRRVLSLHSEPSVGRQRISRPALLLAERRQRGGCRLEQARGLQVDRVRDSIEPSHRHSARAHRGHA